MKKTHIGIESRKRKESRVSVMPSEANVTVSPAGTEQDEIIKQVGADGIYPTLRFGYEGFLKGKWIVCPLPRSGVAMSQQKITAYGSCCWLPSFS